MKHYFTRKTKGLVGFLFVCLMLSGSINSMAQVPSTYQVGQWYQFKSAAISYTFDDNTSNQLPVAIPLLNQYNFKSTLFVVPGWGPNWSGLNTASQNGHEVASHTVSHTTLTTLSITEQDAECKNSQSTINANIPNAKCVTIAYPNCNTGDIPTLQKYYIAGRTCSGQINSSSPTDFYNLSSIICGNTGVNTASEMNTRASGARSSNGWCVFLMHGIDDDGGYSPLASSELSSHLSYVNSNAADYWVGTFGHVAKYIKERNALKITETAVTADSLTLTPTDNLDNSIYDAAITVRRQLPSGWTSARVYVGNTLQDSKIVTVNNVKHIEFDVVPDQGIYSLASSSSSGTGSGNCTESGEGAYYTGVYRNMFKELLNKTDAEINTKVNNAFQQIFYGTSNQKLYYEVGSDMAYILDVNNNDVRSEGMSYGMMISVQLNKQAEFDKLWKWAKTYMQYGSNSNYNGYFAWQLNTDGTIKGNGPASDGEAYFITALFFAANRWGNGTGIFNYEAEAQDILNKTMSKTGAGSVYNLFNTNSKQITFVPYGDSYNFTDPSYHLPGFWELWSRWSATNKAFWSETPAASRQLLRVASHPTSGLTTDYSNFDGTPKEVSYNLDADRFMYDAWRTIMNIGMDYHWFKADAEQPVIAERYLNFFKNQGSGYPNHYDWDGSNPGGDHSTGLVACNAVASLAVNNTVLTTPFVQEFWNVAIPTGTYRYYDGMLYMLALLNVSGNFQVWKPACEDICTTPEPAVTATVSYELGETATALAATGTDLKWYTEAMGGTALASAPVPSTATTGTTTYYVSQTLEGCEGPRASISVIVTNTYRIYKTSLAPAIDGTVDAIWNNPELLPINATKSLVGTVSSTNDLSGTAKYLWDDTYVYIFATITDNAKQNDSENFYEDDAVEFYFDINNDKATAYAANDVQYSFGWNDGAVVGSLPAGRSTTGISYSSVSTTDGYVIEARIPWATLQGTPAAGQSLGIDFMINDDDDGTARDKKLSWNAAVDNAWQDPSLFGTAILLEQVITNLPHTDQGAIYVYPNPAHGFIQVQGIEGIVEYNIVDNSGRLLQSGKTGGQINIANIEAGAYNLVIQSPDVYKVVKLIVNQ